MHRALRREACRDSRRGVYARLKGCRRAGLYPGSLPPLTAIRGASTFEAHPMSSHQPFKHNPMHALWHPMQASPTAGGCRRLHWQRGLRQHCRWAALHAASNEGFELAPPRWGAPCTTACRHPNSTCCQPRAESHPSSCCLAPAVLTADETKVVQTYEIHTPAGASSGELRPACQFCMCCHATARGRCSTAQRPAVWLGTFPASQAAGHAYHTWTCKLAVWPGGRMLPRRTQPAASQAPPCVLHPPGCCTRLGTQAEGAHARAGDDPPTTTTLTCDLPPCSACVLQDCPTAPCG